MAIKLLFAGEYREMIGEPIPYRKLGYSTLEEFLDQSPDLCRVSYSANGVILHGVATEATAHVAALVARQSTKKRSKPVKAPSRRPFSRQWQPPTTSQSFRGGGGGNQFNRNQQGGNRPNRPGGSGRFPTIQNRSPQALAQYQQQQQQQQQRLRTPNYPAVNGMSRGGGRQPQTKPTLANQVRHPLAPDPISDLSLALDPTVDLGLLFILQGRVPPTSLGDLCFLESLADLSDEERLELARQPELYKTLWQLRSDLRVDYFRMYMARCPHVSILLNCCSLCSQILSDLSSDLNQTQYDLNGNSEDPTARWGTLFKLQGRVPPTSLAEQCFLESLADLSDEERLDLARQPELYKTLWQLRPDLRVDYFRMYMARFQQVSIFSQASRNFDDDSNGILELLTGSATMHPSLSADLFQLSDEEMVELAAQPSLYRTLMHVSPGKRVEYFRTHTVSIRIIEFCKSNN